MVVAFNEIQVRRLIKKKGSLTVGTVKALHDALSKLESLPRFDMLKDLLVKHFIGQDKASVLNDLTLGELVELGPLKICALPSMGANKIKLLVKALEPLAAGAADNGIEPEAPLLGNFQVPARQRPTRLRGPSLSPLEAEERLSVALVRLKNSPKFDALKNHTLGEYWEEHWTRAPFEECLTFKQLAEIKVETFFRKRSVNNEKILALIDVINKALAEDRLDVVPEVEPVVVEHFQIVGEVRAQDPRAPSSGWQVESNAYPSYIYGLIRFAEAQIDKASSGVSPFAGLVRSLPQLVTAEEFSYLWLTAERNESLANELPAPNIDVLTERCESFMRSVAPSVFHSWNTILMGSGVSLDALLQPHLDSALDEVFQRIVAKVILSLFGASELELDTHPVPNYWTKNPEAARIMLSALVSSLPKSDSALRAEIKACFPLVSLDAVISIFQHRAEYDNRSKMWIKKK